MSFNLLNKYQKNIYPVSIWVSVIVLLSLLVFRITLVFSYDAHIYGIENNFVYSIQRLMQGLDLYTDPEQLPYAINMYSPFYFSVSAFIGNIFQLNPDEPIHIFWLSRSVSLICDIITCLFLFRILRRRYNVPVEFSLFTLSIFASIICFWGFTFSRSDSMVLTFYSVFIYFLTSNKIDEKKTLLITALISVACIFSKQNAIVVPILAISWLWIQNKRTAILYYVLYFLIAFSGMILLYRYGLNYTYFFDNTVKAIQNRISLPWFYDYIFKRTLNSLWILPFYIALIICLKEWSNKNNNQERAFSVIFFLQLFFSLLISLKIGSSIGYFTESLFLGLIIIARYSVKNYGPELLRNVLSILLPLIILFSIHTIGQGYLFFIQTKNEKRTSYLKQKEIKEYLQPQLENLYLFNLDNPYTSFFKNIFFKNMAAPNFDIIDLATYQDGTFDYSNLEKDFNNGNIKFLIAAENELVTSIWDISLHHYKKDTVINSFAIYKYQKP